MLRYIALRGLLALLVAFTVSLAAFLLLNVAADPAQAIAGEDAIRRALEEVEPSERRRLLGVDPAFVEHLVRAGPWADEGVAERVAVLLALVYVGIPEERLRGGISVEQYALTLSRLVVDGIAGVPQRAAPPSPWF